MLNHYLPASYLSLFSHDINKPRRQRTLYIGDFSDRTVKQSVAGRCAGENGLYNEQIEKFWHLYEPKLPKSIENIINKKINIQDWSLILIPFVASLFVRTRTFNKHMESRLSSLQIPNIEITEEIINFDRIFELQRLLASILAAEWVVCKVNGQTPLICNDLGYAPFINPYTNDSGWAIPLGLSHVLVIIPKVQRKITTYDSGCWKPNIIYSDLPIDNHNSLNSVLGQYSRRFIFASSPTIIKKYLSVVNNSDIPEVYAAGFISGLKAMQYELSWFKFINLINFDLRRIQEIGLQEIGFVEPWYYRVNPLESNLPPFLDPFRLEDNSISMYLY